MHLHGCNDLTVCHLNAHLYAAGIQQVLQASPAQGITGNPFEFKKVSMCNALRPIVAAL